MWTASKLSRECAHHHVLSELHPRPTRDKAAAKGNQFHAALADWHRAGVAHEQKNGDVNTWLDTMIKHGWDWPQGAEVEIAWGLSKWGTFVPVEEKPEGSHNYVALDGEPLLTAGRADACWPIPDDAEHLIASCDWKTGGTLAPARVNLQANAAGMALCQRWKSPGYVPLIYYAREARWDVGELVRLDSAEWMEMLGDIRDAAALDDQPHPGPHCSDCWERKNCPTERPGEST